MSHKKFSLNTFIRLNEKYWSITITEDITSKGRRLYLEVYPIVHQRAIICRSTSYFCTRTLTKNLQYIAKFSLVFDKQRPEADILRLARKRGVERVAKLFDHHHITNIIDMCKGLKFGKLYTFRNTPLSLASPFTPSRSLLSQLFSPRFSLNTAVKPPTKPKSIDTDKSLSKISRFNSQSSVKVN